jgi:hypothetical protein
MKASFSHRGSIHFILDDDEYQDIGHGAIDRCVMVHKIPEAQVVSRVECPDPWKRVLEMDRLCKAAGWSTALNGATIIGGSIKEGDKSQLWQKVLPLEYELICLVTWPGMVRNSDFSPDAWLSNDGQTQKGIDFKCKHREVAPARDFVATVPVSQRKQLTDYYCFGQMRRGMREGYHIGAMSKSRFTALRMTKETDERDSNGERYVDPVDYVRVDQLEGWREDTFDGFFPLEMPVMILGV